MSKDKPKQENREPTIKFVRKAGKWCKTSWIDSKQVQEWLDGKPCEHNSVHDLHCLSCGQKVREIAK